MRGIALALFIAPLATASALAEDRGSTLDTQLHQALAEQSAAEAQTARLEQAAEQARGEEGRLHAEETAAAEGIDAGEARISAANVRLALATAEVAAYRQRIAVEQQPVSALLAGLATMTRRPPLLVLANRGSTDELVEVRLLLDRTLPVIRSRTRLLSAQLAMGEKLQQQALAARLELARSRDSLIAKRQRFAALERRALDAELASGGAALGSGDIAIAAGEDVGRIEEEQTSSQSIRRVAALFAASDPAPPNPFAAQGGGEAPTFSYQLPATAPLTEGLGSVSESGVRARGITLATVAGASVIAPADGIVRFAGPYRDFDGVLIIDHGRGWLSLIVNVASPLHPGDHVTSGDDVGRALGPLDVELSQNGRRISAALIAGSSQNLSKGNKGV